MKCIDLIGRKFERLTVVEKCDHKQGKEIVWKCLCDCGEYTHAIGGNLKKGNVKSCGCLLKEYPKLHYTKQLKHDNERAYRIWTGIKTRCNNRNRPRYNDYGGRGITICEKWSTFDGFWEDMHEDYSDKLTIDRIDNNGNYEKSNCKWSTKLEQANNKRNSILITYKGEVDTLPNLCRKYNINPRVVYQRITRDLKDIETSFAFNTVGDSK